MKPHVRKHVHSGSKDGVFVVTLHPVDDYLVQRLDTGAQSQEGIYESILHSNKLYQNCRLGAFARPVKKIFKGQAGKKPNATVLWILRTRASRAI